MSNQHHLPTAERFWTAQASGKDEATLLLYGDFSTQHERDGDITAQAFAADLKALGDVRQLTIYLNSFGGSVWAGQAIYSQLKRHPARKTVVVDGLAASIASLVAMAGDTVKMHENALMMLHLPWALVVGNSQDLMREAQALEKVAEAMVVAYKAKTGPKATEAKIKEWLTAETWFSPAEAVAAGLADEVITGTKAIAAHASPEWAAEYLARYQRMPAEAKQALVGRAARSRTWADLSADEIAARRAILVKSITHGPTTAVREDAKARLAQFEREIAVQRGPSQ